MIGGSTKRHPVIPDAQRRASVLSLVLHLLIAAAITQPWRHLGALRQAPAARPMTVVMMPPPEDARFPGLKPVPEPRADWTIRPGDQAATLRLPSFNIDVSKISDRAYVLFPFLTPGLSLEHLTPPQNGQTRLVNPFARARTADPDEPGGPLVMDDAALQALVDKAWSRHGRWASFEPISKLAQAHSPTDGRVPDLLRMYCEQNALQPYTDTNIRDPRLWAQLGLAADHVSFITFIREYSAEHPSTRATTELLFLLDRVAEANRDALNALLDNPPTETLAWTRAGSPKAFQLVSRIRFYYQQELNKRALMSEESIDVYYEKSRLAILEAIVRTTPRGYRANDARFLIGAIHWRQRNPIEALRWWRQLAAGPGDARLPGTVQMASVFANPNFRDAGRDAPPDALLRRDIERVLKNELGRWVSFSYDRLARFGYRFDSF
jgi:hypothetical protein